MTPNPLALRRALLVLVAATAGGCAVLDRPRRITLDESELQRLIERQFPLDRRLLDVLEVTVSTPRLQLLPDQNRLATELAVSTRDRLFGAQWQGRLALDSALRWEPADQSIRLANVRVHRFSLDGGGSLARSQAERLGAVLAERVLEDFSVYRLPAERALALQRAGTLPSAVNVTSRGVEITLEPPAR